MRRNPALPLALLLAACSSSDSTPPPESVDPALVAALRNVVAAQSLEPAPAAPAVDAALVELGRSLYFDKELSGNRDVSCSTCHLPSRAGSDARALPRGVAGAGIGPDRLGGAIVPRHSPMNLCVDHAGPLFWDGRVGFAPMGEVVTPAGAEVTPAMRAVFPAGLELLSAQAMFPPTSRAEMRGDPGENELADFTDSDFTGIWGAIVARLVTFPAYVDAFAAAFPGTSVNDLSMAHVGASLAAFQAVELHCVDSPFQAFLLGDDDALTNAELRGALAYFDPSSTCTVCHHGPLFTDGRFHNIGLPQFGPGKGNGPLGNDDFGHENVTGDPADRYTFRTPSLINVALTAPYGHAGQYSTLRSIVAHYDDVSANLAAYDIAEHVADPELLATQVANEVEVLATVHPLLTAPLGLDIDGITTFLGALSATSARDLSGVVPASVPSGSTIDG